MVKPVPDGFHTVTPYLVVEGVPRLIDFLTQAFHGKEEHRQMRPDGAVLHAQVRVGDSPIMMGEASEMWPAMPGSIYLYLEDVDDAYNRAIRAGATTIMEPMNQFYGDRMGGVKDPVGNSWWLSTHVEDVPPDEMDRRAAALFAQQGGHHPQTA